MLTGYHKKIQEKVPRRDSRKVSKSFWRKNRHQYACEKYQNLSEEEKNKMRKYCRERYKNLFESEKQKLVEYRKNIYVRLSKI